MHQGSFVFSQLTEFLPRRVFDRIVKKYEGNKGVRSFTCWNQMLFMIFGQLTSRESMRDLFLSLEGHQHKFYHLGFGSRVSRRNLGRANEKRSCRIYEDFAYELIDLAKNQSTVEKLHPNIDSQVFALDSTTIDLCLNVFWWAEFRRNKGAVKMHTLYDVETSVPDFIHISTGAVHDVNVLDMISYQPSCYYVMDKAYIDWKRLYAINSQNAFFVTRAKTNMRFKRIYSNKKTKGSGVRYDQVGTLVGHYAKRDYPIKMRRIKYYDAEKEIELIFLTNNMTLDALDIAFLYKKRWEVELFFKWMKQHLKIKKFWGTSINAVKTQIYCAIIAYCLIMIVKNQLKSERRIYEILQILSISMFDKTTVNELINLKNYKAPDKTKNNQLKINYF